MSEISIETKRIDEMEALKEVAGDGQLLYYAANGKETNRFTVDDLLDYLRSLSPNSLFRGKYLGDHVTDEQYADVQNGTFKLVQLGDYWTISGHNWRNWGANWFKGRGDSPLNANHVVIMPDDNLLKSDGSTTHYMQDSNDTTGGYKNSKMRKTYVPQMIATIQSIFGADHVLKHRELITNAVANGASSNWEWVDSYVEIPSESMVFGSRVCGGQMDTSSQYSQLPLAQVKPEFICNRENYWLRGVASASHFADVDTRGYASYVGASLPWDGVRPYFLLG